MRSCVVELDVFLESCSGLLLQLCWMDCARILMILEMLDSLVNESLQSDKRKSGADVLERIHIAKGNEHIHWVSTSSRRKSEKGGNQCYHMISLTACSISTLICCVLTNHIMHECHQRDNDLIAARVNTFIRLLRVQIINQYDRRHVSLNKTSQPPDPTHHPLSSDPTAPDNIVNQCVHLNLTEHHDDLTA